MERRLESLIEFDSLITHGVFLIDRIDWWLFAYEDFYNNLKSSWSCPNQNCYYDCYCNNVYEETIFMELYVTLGSFLKYHEREGYAQQELEKYHRIKNDERLVKEWVKDNEKIGADECLMFLIEHYDYEDNPIHLKVRNKSLLGYDLLVYNGDFKSLIEYLEIFSDLFWEKQVYPESEILMSLGNEPKPDVLIDWKDL